MLLCRCRLRSFDLRIGRIHLRFQSLRFCDRFVPERFERSEHRAHVHRPLRRLCGFRIPGLRFRRKRFSRWCRHSLPFCNHSLRRFNRDRSAWRCRHVRGLNRLLQIGLIRSGRLSLCTVRSAADYRDRLTLKGGFVRSAHALRSPQ